MAINYQKIAECVADEILPIEKELSDLKSKILIAMEILHENDCTDEYLKRWRKEYLRQNILISDDLTPMEIFKVAQEDWRTSNNGGIELVLQNATSQSGNFMIIVHAKHVASNRTTTLFSVVHLSNNPYPVAIQLEDVFIENIMFILNKQVLNTPSEFRKKLAEVFNLGDVKGKILNLA